MTPGTRQAPRLVLVAWPPRALYCLFWLFGAILFSLQLTRPLHPDVKVLWGVLAVLSLAAAFRASLMSEVIASSTAVTLRDFYRTDRLAWRDILCFEERVGRIGFSPLPVAYLVIQLSDGTVRPFRNFNCLPPRDGRRSRIATAVSLLTNLQHLINEQAVAPTVT